MPDLTIAERGTGKLTGTLTDEAGAPVSVANVQTLTLTLYERESGSLVNPGGRPAGQDIKNANGGTLDTSGAFALVLSDLDHAILDTTRAYELHYALVQWTLTGGAKPGRQRFRIAVENQRKVT